MSHRKHVHVIGTLLCAAALAACSSSTSPTSAGAPAPAPRTTGSSAAAASPGVSPSVAPGPGMHFLAKDTLAAALLPVSDLPAGWAAGKSGESLTGRSFCDYKQPHAPQVEASGTFRTGTGHDASIAAVGLRQYATPSDAEEVLDAMEQALQTCRKETYKGSVRTYSPVHVDKLGDRSLGVRIEGGGSTVLQQFTLDGPTLVNAGTDVTADADAHTAALLLRKQVGRYEAAAAR
ncbi:hypothetical protein ACFYXS_32130 [Streptomyces sp. NPDC002574]|uniref:hypothetical protein n=1 Tax=Streptomyces sp. NPDC002574 TaxID=3364652 RepID=UPI00367A1464